MSMHNRSICNLICKDVETVETSTQTLLKVQMLHSCCHSVFGVCRQLSGSQVVVVNNTVLGDDDLQIQLKKLPCVDVD